MIIKLGNRLKLITSLILWEIFFLIMPKKNIDLLLKLCDALDVDVTQVIMNLKIFKIFFIN